MINGDGKQSSPDTTHSAEGASCGLSEAAFRPISPRGFGESGNSYPHSMAWFKDHLFVGTARHVLVATSKCLDIIKRDHQLAIWPVRVPEEAYDLDWRAQIWRYDARMDAWSKVLTSPTVEVQAGLEVPRALGFRAMCAFPSSPEDQSRLYVMSSSGHHIPESAVFHSEDGMNFDMATMPTLVAGSPVRMFRQFAEFKGKLFTAPTGGPARGQVNLPGTMTVIVTSDPIRGEWEQACLPYFGDRSNLSVMGLGACNEHLYAGTLNVADGFQVWKTDARGKPPYQWKRVLAHGAYRGRTNQYAMTMRQFGGHLYIGSAVQNGGYDADNRIGPAAIELIRLHADDSWDLLVGEPRQTPDGLKIPIKPNDSIISSINEI